MSETKVGPAATSIEVPWVVGTVVAAKPAKPTEKGKKTGLKLEEMKARLQQNRARLDAHLATKKYPASVREQLEAMVAFDERRVAWMDAASTSKRKDLEARLAVLVASLGAEIEYLDIGVPADRKQDWRLLDELAETSIIRFALSRKD